MRKPFELGKKRVNYYWECPCVERKGGIGANECNQGGESKASRKKENVGGGRGLKMFGKCPIGKG